MTLAKVIWLIVSLISGLTKCSNGDLLSSIPLGKSLNRVDLNEQCRAHIEAYQAKIASPTEGPAGLWALKSNFC